MSELAITKENLPSKNSAIFGVLWVIALGLPMFLWLNHTGNPFEYFKYSAPAGQITYLFSRLFGLYAFSLLIMQVILMLAKRVGYFHNWKICGHRNLGIITLGLAALHAVLFVLAKSLRAGYFSYEVLIPSFSDGYYKAAVSLGVISSVFIVCSIISGVCKQKRKRSLYWFGTTHYIGYVVVISTFTHLVLIGSD